MFMIMLYLCPLARDICRNACETFLRVVPSICLLCHIALVERVRLQWRILLTSFVFCWVTISKLYCEYCAKYYCTFEKPIFFLSRVSSKSSISRIMRFLIRKITESYIHNLYSGTKLDNEIIIRSRKFSMLHVCFLLKQNFQNYCFLLYAWPTILLEYQMRPLLAERILRAPSPLHRIAWQHSRRVM